MHLVHLICLWLFVLMIMESTALKRNDQRHINAYAVRHIVLVTR